MRRPLCAFCAGMLGLESVRVFLPQTELFVPFAAFFAAICFALCIPGRTRKAAVCLLLGAAAGFASVQATEARLEQTRTQYAGRPVMLTAEVESAAASDYGSTVDAVLQVENVNGSVASFRVECETLPACTAGQRVQGRFVLSVPEAADRFSLYADGIALQARPDEDKPDFAVLGESNTFRARTVRLQQRLSGSLRAGMSEATGGVLAAMTVGDRSWLSSALRSAYRGAGLSHVLVVSGLHVSILCGELFGALPLPRKRERSYRSRRAKAVWSAVLALLLVGVTGFTPSVCRAAVAVWVSALGVWVYGPPDALTSLAVAGILMTAANSYAVGDIGFELSFAAVVGTLCGAECTRRLQEGRTRRRAAAPHRKTGPAERTARSLWNSLCETACIAVCASAATFPVLVLRGLSVSVWAVVSSVAVLWLVKPMLLLGLAAAFTGLVPVLGPVYNIISRAAELLTGLLDTWAVWLSAKPGAGLYFDTAYAALVCLALCGLCWLAYHERLRLRVAVPGILLTAAVAIGLGNALSRDVVHMDLVGAANAPAVVVAQNDTAVVLFRGGPSNQRAVENQLARRGVHTVELVVDLRLNDAKSRCTLPAVQRYRMAALPAGNGCTLHSTPAKVELLRTRHGGLVRLTIGNRQFAVLCGNVELAKPLSVEWLLASGTKPQSVQWQRTLALQQYGWMAPDTEPAASLSLRRRGGLKIG